MRTFILTTGNALRNAVISILLWAYAGLMIFTWHLARLTPDNAVLLRVGASVLNDLVWIPLGILVWSLALIMIARVFRIFEKRKLALKIVVIVTVTALHIVFTETAFRFLFIPLLIASIQALYTLISGRGISNLFGRGVPLTLAAALTVFNYQHQMIPSRESAPTGETLKIMSYNIFFGGDDEDRRKVIEIIRREDPDVVCCIEMDYSKDLDLFDRELGDRYPYRVLSDNSSFAGAGSAILSKYPVRAQKTEELNLVRNRWSSRVSLIFAEMNMRGRKINLVSYHLKSVGHYIEYIAGKDFPLREKIDWAAKNELKYDREKLIQAQSLVELATASSAPTILCGDLNDTPNSRAFHALRRHYKNAYSERGWGLGATFGESRIQDRMEQTPIIPRLARDVIRIDHIFVSKDIRIREARVASEAKGSDHKPVLAVVEFD